MDSSADRPKTTGRALLIVPTYNESSNIAELIEKLSATVKSVHLLVVDDDSPDGTAEIVEKLRASYPHLEILRRKGERALGHAYTAGIIHGLKSGFEIIGTMDADLSHDPSYLPQMLVLLQTNDVVIGSRYIRGGGIVNWKIGRIVLSWLANKFAATLLQIPAHDITSGYRLYRRQALQWICTEEIKSTGYSFLAELLYRAHRTGARIAEYPIVFHDRIQGVSKLHRREIYLGALNLLRLRFAKHQACRPFDEEAFPRDVKPREEKPPRRLRSAIVIAVLYFAMIALAPLPDRLVLFPTTHRLDAGAAVRKPIPFEGGELEIWTAASRLAQQRGRPEIYMLRFYGNADRADRWVADEAEMWNNRAVEVWGMNYPGFGGSTGPARLARLGPAALAAFDAAKSSAGDRPVIVFGASLGTTTALHIAAQRKVAGVILHNPVALRQIILRQFGWWNLWLLAGPLAQKIPVDLDSLANARAIRAPAIFLLAERDEVVAPKFQHLVVDAYAGEKRVITLAGADHNSPVEGAGLANFHNALDWLLPRSPD